MPNQEHRLGYRLGPSIVDEIPTDSHAAGRVEGFEESAAAFR